MLENQHDIEKHWGQNLKFKLTIGVHRERTDSNKYGACRWTSGQHISARKIKHVQMGTR